MGRELRMVAPNWKHPRDPRGNFLPMYNRSYRTAAEEWLKNLREFEPHDGCEYFWEWDGNPPDKEYYMYLEDPDPETLTHFQMYENTTEGTPISPVCATVSDLCWWLVDMEASAFGSKTASYETWMAVCKYPKTPALVEEERRRALRELGE